MKTKVEAEHIKDDITKCRAEWDRVDSSGSQCDYQNRLTNEIETLQQVLFKLTGESF